MITFIYTFATLVILSFATLSIYSRLTIDEQNLVLDKLINYIFLLQALYAAVIAIILSLVQ